MPMGRRHGTHHLAQEAPYLTIFLGVEPVRFMPLVQSGKYLTCGRPPAAPAATSTAGPPYFDHTPLQDKTVLV
jgi:hypothetical protein